MTSSALRESQGPGSVPESDDSCRALGMTTTIIRLPSSGNILTIPESNSSFTQDEDPKTQQASNPICIGLRRCISCPSWNMSFRISSENITALVSITALGIAVWQAVQEKNASHTPEQQTIQRRLVSEEAERSPTVNHDGQGVIGRREVSKTVFIFLSLGYYLPGIMLAMVTGTLPVAGLRFLSSNLVKTVSSVSWRMF